MKKSKLLLASLLAMLIIASTVFASLSIATDENTAEAYSGSCVWGFDPTSSTAVSAYSFNIDNVIAYRVNIGVHFDAVGLNCVASQNNSMVGTFSLFKWAGDYSTTILTANNSLYLLAQTAQQTWGQGNNILLDPGKVCAPGEYLVTLYVPSTSPAGGAIFHDPNTSISKGITYLSGTQLSGIGDWRLELYATETGTYFYTPGTTFTSSCADSDNNHYCDQGCGASLSTCADTNNDHFCEICGGPAGDCIDENPKDHVCDIEGCDNVLSSCVDDDNSAYCDICGEKMPPQNLSTTAAHVWAANPSSWSPWEITWSEYGVRMNLAGRFNGAMFNLCTWATSSTKASIGVFKWTGSYQSSIQNAVAIQENITVTDGFNWIYFDPQEPGEYLFVVYDISTPINTQTMGIYRNSNNAVSHCQCFENGWTSNNVDSSICIQFTKYLADDQFLPLGSDPLIFYDEVTEEETTTVETEAVTTEEITTEEITTEEITTEEITTEEITTEEITTEEITTEEITTEEITTEEITTEEITTEEITTEEITTEEITTEEITTEEITTEEETSAKATRPRPTVTSTEDSSEEETEPEDQDDDDGDDENDSSSVKKEGCGSSVGGLAIISISAAGIAIITRKSKKEN